MREFKYDVIQLIHSVQNRPCLWDKTIENYKDRVERRSAWEEIFCTLEETYEEMTPEEKRITGEQILNKWTNIRDTFAKTLKTKMGRPKKKYLLYDHLKFLTKIMPESESKEYEEETTPYLKQEVQPETSYTITCDMEPHTKIIINEVNNMTTKKRPKPSDCDEAKSNEYSLSDISYVTKKRSKRSDFDDAKSTDYSVSEVSYGSQKRKSKRFVFPEDNNSNPRISNKKKSKKANAKDIGNDQTSVNDVQVQANDDLNDVDFVEIDDSDPRIMNEDEAFFASLLPTVVKYDEDERLEFRIEVLSVMKKIKNKRKWTILEYEK